MSLSEVSKDFFKQAHAYLKALEDRVQVEKENNPSSKKYVLLSDELRNTRRIWNTICDRREKKIILMALSAARGGTVKPQHITREEKILYDALLLLLRDHRKRILESTAKEALTIRILEDIPQFVGSDMNTYVLHKEDVLMLPADVAQVLITRKAAEELNAEV